eukprot:7752786-Ditylum_brightwellii.AAC.1
MKQYGIPLGDCQLHKALLYDIVVLNKKHETGQQKNMLSHDGISKGMFNLVAIPRANSQYSTFHRTTRNLKWVHNLLSALAGGGADS